MKEFFSELLVVWLITTLFWGLSLFITEYDFVLGIWLGISVASYLKWRQND